MQLIDLRIRNYRTVKAEQSVRLASGTTMVGPNNSGKTNLLRAILVFFTGYKNLGNYSRELDLTFGAGSQRSSFVATFGPSEHPAESEIYELLDELHAIVGTERTSDQFTISLYFTGPEDTPVYRVFPNQKVTDEAQRPNFSRKQKELVELVIGIFKCHYVPSAKSVATLYDDLLNPFLVGIAAEVLTPQFQEVMDALSEVAESVNHRFRTVGLEDLTADFSLRGTLQDLINGFELTLSDPHATPISRKGQGVQSAALFACFLWITHQEVAQYLRPIWLIEEPESYLHPELAGSVHRMLEELSAESQVVLTTHSIAFVPSDVDRVTGTDLGVDGFTLISKFHDHREATARIRASLGVKFSDYYNLDDYNVFVEGPSDVELIMWFIDMVEPDGDYEWPSLRSATIDSFGGVSQLEGFLRGSYPLIRPEKALVAVFDGDAAGEKARRNLQSFFGAKDVPFASGEDFLTVRQGYAIEGLFPDGFISLAHDEHPGWFIDFSVDAMGDVQPFRVQDRNKRQMIDYLTLTAEAFEDDLWWADRWLIFCTALDAALRIGGARIYH